MTNFFPEISSGCDLGVLPLLNEWKQKGWCRTITDGQWSLNSDLIAETDHRLDDVAYADWPVHGAQLISSRDICFHDEAITHEIWASAGSMLCEEIERLQGFLGGLPDALRPTDARFALWINGSKCHLFLNGNHLTVQDVSQATGFLYQAIVTQAFPKYCDHITMHAAAVAIGQGTLIMPAVSGSGKTTLTAYLVAQGWSYGGDDIIGLAKMPKPDGALRLLPFPSALGIKDGSWEALIGYFPELRHTPIVNYGAKRVRYLPVPTSRHVPANDAYRQPVGLVFPEYVGRSASSLEEVSELEALGLILESGIGASRALDLDGFSTVVELIHSVPSYRLKYDRLDEAERELAQLL